MNYYEHYEDQMYNEKIKEPFVITKQTKRNQPINQDDINYLKKILNSPDVNIFLQLI